MKRIFSIILVLLFIISCNSMPQRLSSTLPKDKYEDLGEARCRKCSFLLFGVIPIVFRSLPVRAYRCAVQNRGGDDLINPTVQESWYWTPVMGIYCTTVSGTVIKKKR